MERGKPEISIVIPTLNEEENIENLLQQLSEIDLAKEIILVDGGSEDQTTTIAQSYADSIISSEQGRGHQLSRGAELAKADHLLFLHADVRFMHVPTTILKELKASQVSLASFSLQFDKAHWFLKLNAYFSSFPFPYFHFGDQGL